MTRACLLLIVATAGCSNSKSPTPNSVPPPPVTRVAPVTETLHGISVTDDYRWLEGDNSDPRSPGRMTPEVTAWTDGQRRYTRSVLDALPNRGAWASRLAGLEDAGEVTMPTVRNNRYFYSNRNLGEPDVAILTRDG